MVARSGSSAERFFSAIAIGRSRSELLREHSRHAREQRLHLAAHEIDERGIHALVGDMDHLDAGLFLKSSAARCEALPTPAEP